MILNSTRHRMETSMLTLQVSQIDSVHDVAGCQISQILYKQSINKKQTLLIKGRRESLGKENFNLFEMCHHIRMWGGQDASCGCGLAQTAPPSQSVGRGWVAAERCAGRGPCSSPGSLPATSRFSYSGGAPTACSSSSARGDLIVRCCETRPPCP